MYKQVQQFEDEIGKQTKFQMVEHVHLFFFGLNKLNIY